jgi:hypothetical protein
MKKSPADECDASRESEKRHALDASVVYDTTSARLPDLPHGKPDTKRDPLARASFIKVVDFFQP